MFSAASLVTPGKSGSLQGTEVLECLAYLQRSSVTFWTRGLVPCLAVCQLQQPVMQEWGTALDLRVSTPLGGWGLRCRVSCRIVYPSPRSPTHCKQDCCRLCGGRPVLWGALKIQHHYHKFQLQTVQLLLVLFLKVMGGLELFSQQDEQGAWK